MSKHKGKEKLAKPMRESNQKAAKTLGNNSAKV